MYQEEHKKTRMEIIREGLFEEHPAGDDNCEFADAVLDLFKEYTNDYTKKEWERIDDNERMYHGNHWEGEGYERFGDPRQPNMPKPATPIITSAIENIKADLSDGFPEATIKPDGVGNEVLAKVLTAVISEELDVCGFEAEYDKMIHDVLNCGWGVWEVGYDPSSNSGLGGSYIRYVVNKNWMCDPQVPDIQDGRAIFKFERKPADWFAQHYPEHYRFMKGDEDLIESGHDDFEATTAPSDHHDYRLIEAWFRVYDAKAKKHTVHFVKIAGRQVLENSAVHKPKGYYKHGKYPFIVCALYPQKGSALGLGVTDLFKAAQRYSDKLDQILITNAFRASRPRIIVQKGMADWDDVRDFSKEVIEVEGAPNAVAQWQQPQPLPSYIMDYIMSIRATIKEESGTNDQSRGQTSGGVTAASAITALQEMSTKRSRMEERKLHYAFRDAVRMMLEVIREFAVTERQVPITVLGQPIVVPFSRKFMENSTKGGYPIEHYVNIRAARQTKYTRMMHNELLLQMMQLLQGTVDPVIMMEGLDYDGLEPLLDNVRKAQNGGMLAMQRQLQDTAQRADVAEQQNMQYLDDINNLEEQIQLQREISNRQQDLANERTKVQDNYNGVGDAAYGDVNGGAPVQQKAPAKETYEATSNALGAMFG